MNKPVIFLSREAENDLDAIYEYYFESLRRLQII